MIGIEEVLEGPCLFRFAGMMYADPMPIYMKEVFRDTMGRPLWFISETGTRYPVSAIISWEPVK